MTCYFDHFWTELQGYTTRIFWLGVARVREQNLWWIWTSPEAWGAQEEWRTGPFGHYNVIMFDIFLMTALFQIYLRIRSRDFNHRSITGTRTRFVGNESITRDPSRPERENVDRSVLVIIIVIIPRPFGLHNDSSTKADSCQLPSYPLWS